MFNPETLDISTLPSVALEARRELPACQGVYFVMTPTEVLYIGKTKSIAGRWLGHHRLNELRRHEGVVISWLRFDGGSDLLDEIEQACIEYFSPLLNWAAVRYNKCRVRSMVFPAGLYERLEKAAQREERPISDLVLEAVRRQLKEIESGNSEALASA